jgi:hypothetical protein
MPSRSRSLSTWAWRCRRCLAQEPDYFGIDELRKTVLAASVGACFPFYRSACALHASYRLRWHGTLQRGRWMLETPDVWGRFA